VGKKIDKRESTVGKEEDFFCYLGQYWDPLFRYLALAIHCRTLAIFPSVAK
jgi:hypothetical protein